MLLPEVGAGLVCLAGIDFFVMSVTSAVFFVTSVTSAFFFVTSVTSAVFLGLADTEKKIC